MSKCWNKMYRRNADYDSDSDSVQNFNTKEVHPQSCACKCVKWTLIILFTLIVLLFICIFVIVPIVFMETVSLQRKLIFLNFDQPSDPQYENYDLYGAKGVHNRYVSVQDILNSSSIISLGVWQVVPEDRINATEASNFNYDKELLNSKKPICIYFHGQSGTRIYPYPMYERLRKFFHILAVDYRSYGDSTEAFLTEEAVVADLTQFYYKVLEMTKQKEIYFWGHSLGTALSTHVLKKLTENRETAKNKLLPRALMLEAPFTTMREEIPNHPIGKILAWLPWFTVTILDPLEKNGFRFWTKHNILTVNSPIMITHAMDDGMIPYTLGEKLAAIATNDRNKDTQGPVTLHIIPAAARCNHMNIYTYPPLEEFVKDFLKSVDDWYKYHPINKL